MSDKNSAIVIRTRNDGDLSALADLLVEVHERDGYPVEGVNNPVGWLTSERILGAWVAECGSSIVGHVALTEPSDSDDAARLWTDKSGSQLDSIAVLGRLFVGVQARGQRVGQRLTIVATQHAQALNRRAVLDVMQKDTAAIRTYEALGWQKLGSITHRFGNDQCEPALAYVSPAQSADDPLGEGR